MAVLLFLGLVSFDANDPSFNLVKSGKSEIRNMAGLFGAYAAGFLNDIFGICSLLWPFVFGFLGGAYISARYTLHWWRWCGLFLLTICGLVFSSAFDLTIGDLGGGGMVGNTLYYNGARYLSPVGTFLVWLFIFLAGLQLFCNFSWISLFARASQAIADKAASPVARARFSRLSGFFSGLKKTDFSLPAFLKKENLAKISTCFKGGKAAGKVAGLPVPDMPPQQFPAQNEDAPEHRAANLPEEDDPFAPVQDLGRVTSGNNPVVENISWGEEVSQKKIQPDEPVVETPLPAHETGMAHHPRAQEQSQAYPASAVRPSLKLFEAGDDITYPLPDTSLLKAPVPIPPASMDALQAKGRDLMTCFHDFGVDGELVKITPGPVITRYEVRPAAGVSVKRIANLSDDLSLSLRAVSVRIQQVPGSNTVGIEIPNDEREVVNFRELVESDAFREGCGPLTIILGKTTAGRPYLADLTKMPHLLVGGTTGAGKSVSLNAMLISLLYKHQPRDLKLLLIDPKRVEMAVYADLPHLVHPVVTEMEDAKTAFEWAIHEMQDRFLAIQRLGVRNVAAYNQRLAAYGDTLPEDFGDLRPLPHIVIVVDELADLMMTMGREVEGKITRLLQLSRAAGMHLILATQRPSVDVVTGLLKANLNCRVAFKVISKHDSRTILDQVGAEQLLGRGDMLFKPAAGALVRLHAPFLGDDEIQTVVNYWKSQQAPAYDIDFSRWRPPSEISDSSGRNDGNSQDELYEDARAFIMDKGRASISLLQRHLKIGFNRAARLMEQFEKDGIISPADGSKPRTVIRN